MENKMNSEMESTKIQISPDLLKELVVGNKTFRSTMDFLLHDSDIEICRKELNETEGERDASIRNLREMLCNDGEIKYRTDDDYLLRYLRYKKFKVKETYKHLRKFYKTRMEYPNLYYLPTYVDRLLKSDFAYLLPYTDEQGRVIFIIKMGNWKLDEVDFRDAMIIHNMVCDVVSSNPRYQITGTADIFDLAGITLSHVAHITNPRNLSLWTTFLQELYPWRIKSLVFYNCNPFLYSVFVSVRCFLKKKIADRLVFLHPGLEELHKHIPPTVLPKEYGGTLEESEYKPYLSRCLLDNLRYLEYEHSFIGKNKP